MKRIGNLYERIVDWDNLVLAFYLARKGARDSLTAQKFEANLGREIASLIEELDAREVKSAGFTRFKIYDPKEREITAPAFRDRVLHHAIMNVCEPYFDSWLIYDSYACRIGKGRLRALQRATEYARRHPWYVKMDIRAYFASIPHETLLIALRRKFKDPDLLELFEKMLGWYAMNGGRGLPIGSLVSQHLANFYLGAADRLIKEKLRLRGYVRYMDDFVIWGNDRAEVKACWQEVVRYVSEELGLEVKRGGYMGRTSQGMDFCGFRVFPGWRVLNRRSRRRFRVKLQKLMSLEDEHEQQVCSGSLFAFAMEGNTWQFRRRELVEVANA